MADRDADIQNFLKSHGVGGAMRQKMGGDASFRRYERLTQLGRSCILMDAPPPQEDVRPFVKMARYLNEIGLRAPKILAEDAGRGLLLLEDFGDARFNLYLKAHPEQEEKLYTKAVEVLAELHKHPPLAIPAYDEKLLIEHVGRFLEWYVPHIAKRQIPRRDFVAAWKAVLPKRDAGKPVVALFDFHADNLMWLAEGDVGLLDFQDALLAPPTYDLVSLLQDCRRPVLPSLEQKMLAHYRKISGLELETSYAIMGAQRHTRILGTFARLAVRDNKPHYLNWVPQEWAYLKQNLAHPALSPLKKWFEENGF